MPQSSQSPLMESRPLTPQQAAVLKTARTSIQQRGMIKTTMLSLANDMGISRQTLYRAFDNRDELFAMIYVKEFDAAVTASLTGIMQDLNFEQAIAESVQHAITLVDENPVLVDMMLGSGSPWFQSQILDCRSPLFIRLMEFGYRLWQQQLSRARDQRRLKETLTDAEVVEWLLTHHYLMMMRPINSRERDIRILRKLVIPALLEG